MRYQLEETFVYEIEADTEEEALELYQRYQEANTTEEEEELEVSFSENFTEIHTTEREEN